MPIVEIDKQIDHLQGKSTDTDSSDITADEWDPPVSRYVCTARARIADTFFGPEAEPMTGEKALTRRIQVIDDVAALCKLREPSRRGKSFDWNEEDMVNGDSHRLLEQAELDTKTTATVPREPSSRQCPFCFFDNSLPEAARKRELARPDSLRRHILRVHLNRASRHGYGFRGFPRHHYDQSSRESSYESTEDSVISCPDPACDGILLKGQRHYMSHSAKIHGGPFRLFCHNNLLHFLNIVATGHRQPCSSRG